MSENLRHPELIYNDGSLTWEQKASELLDCALSARTRVEGVTDERRP